MKIASKIGAGEIVYDEGVANMTTKKTKIEKEPVELQQVTATKKRIDDTFWNPKSAKELREEQNVKPFDFSKAGENWPIGADFEEFKAAINSVRKYPREW
jgi:hypothetical protein